MMHGWVIDELVSTNLPHVQVPPTWNPLHDTEYEELQCLVNLDFW